MIYHCWSERWRSAAIEAGFAKKTDYGYQFFSDEFRDRLAKFAELITEQPSTAEDCTAPSRKGVGQGEVAPPKTEKEGG